LNADAWFARVRALRLLSKRKKRALLQSVRRAAAPYSSSYSDGTRLRPRCCARGGGPRLRGGGALDGASEKLVSSASDGKSWLSATEADGSGASHRRRNCGSCPCRRAPCDGARGGATSLRRAGGASDDGGTSLLALAYSSSLPSSSSSPLAALSSRLLRRLGPALPGGAARCCGRRAMLPVAVLPVR